MKKYLCEKPNIQINKPLKRIFKELESIIGEKELHEALNCNKNYHSPIANQKDSSWIKSAKIIGINPRIAGTYFNIVKYAMTFPEDSIHIMPLWEDGCAGNIYARINWKLNSKWLDKELFELGYDTCEKQLKITINLLHALGKKVGFDLVPHTDKFSEEVFIIPECFEWIRLNNEKTEQINYSDTEYIYPLIKSEIINFLKTNKTADEKEFTTENLYENYNYSEIERIIFGEDLQTRTKRRIDLMNFVREKGFETIPVTEHSPLRPIKFDKIVRDENISYATYEVKNKSPFALMFNSITPYRWFKIDNQGFIDVNRPITKTFDYFLQKTANFQKEYNFDFFRADMGHNQISHAHSGQEKDIHYQYEMLPLKAH